MLVCEVGGTLILLYICNKIPNNIVYGLPAWKVGLFDKDKTGLTKRKLGLVCTVDICLSFKTSIVRKENKLPIIGIFYFSHNAF